MDSCKAIAPSSTANLGPGFDTFGLALDIFNDEVRISKKGNKTKKITISNIKQEYGTKIPFEVENNSAALVVQRMMEDFKIEDYIDIEITKGIPPGYGLGSSAASSVAAAFAFNQVYNLKLDVNELINFAAEGERASAGIKHYDNVASSMLGGFIIVRTTPLLEIIKFDPPEDLYLIVGIPKIIVPKKKTQAARGLLPLSFPLENIVTNISNASTIVAGFANNDVEMIAKGIDDKIVEPVRKKMIPGFDNVKQKALHAGALAVTISGAGPSVISILKTAKHSNNIIEAIKEGFAESKIQSEVYICKPSDGVKIKSI